MGKPISELRGMKMRMVPNSASLKPKNVFMVGMREAQVEKQKPERKKKRFRKARCLFCKSMRREFGYCLSSTKMKSDRDKFSIFYMGILTRPRSPVLSKGQIVRYHVRLNPYGRPFGSSNP